MKKLIKLVILLVIIGAIVKVVVGMVAKSKFASMSDEEIRAFLAAKLDGKVSEEQLASIQDAVIAGIRGAEAGAPEMEEAATEDADEAEEVEEAEEAEDAEEASAEAAGEKAAELIEAVVEAVDED